MLLAFSARADVVVPPKLSSSEIVAMCPFMDLDQPDPETMSYDGTQSNSDGAVIKQGFNAYKSEALKDAFDICIEFL